MTAEQEIQVSWRVIARGEVSPARPSFDEQWLLDPRIGDADIVCCCSVDADCLTPAESNSQFSRLPSPATSILVLIPRKSPPELEQSWDGEVASFLVSVGLIRAFRRSGESGSFSCFDLLHWALNNRSQGVSFECLQVPLRRPERGGEAALGAAAQWIIPHKAPLLMLESCLRNVGESRGRSDIVSVCFDEEATDAHRDLVDRLPWVEFYESKPCPNGPYVSRERFLRTGKTPFVIFQDSDDAPTVSRRKTLLSELIESGADLIGSHELHVNEIWRKVHAVRYPLDPCAALAKTNGHTLLLPASAGRRGALSAAGGFSTHRVYNSDMEFVLRASLFLKLRNVDEFLYIRRIRAGSLTQAPDTGILSAERQVHTAALRADFERIKRGELSLEQSLLTPRHRDDFDAIRIRRLHRPRSVAGLCRDAWRFATRR